MAIFLVDLQIREKARRYFSLKETWFILLFVVFALLPWAAIVDVMRTFSVANVTDIGAAWHRFATSAVGGDAAAAAGPDVEAESHCNPKFPKLCVH